jgi:hypothetical protein
MLTRVHLQPPFMTALLHLRHRLVASQLEANRAAIARVAAASLPALPPLLRESGLDKQDPPEVGPSEGSTDRNPEQRIHGGRWHHGSK